MSKRSLPPKVGAIVDGAVQWQRLGDIDYELLGYFLSCHLIIEHYLDQTLRVMHPQLGWEASKQTFGQKTALLSNLDLPEDHKALPAIKHMNAVRNKISHRVDFKIKDEDLLPFLHLLQKGRNSESPLPTDAHAILEEFTGRVCAFFAGVVAGTAHHKRRSAR